MNICFYAIKKIFLLFLLSLFSFHVMSEVTVSAKTKSAINYYYVLSPKDTDCSNLVIESGWISSSDWHYSKELPADCDYIAQVYINNIMTEPDVEINIISESDAESTNIQMLNSLTMSSDTERNGMVFSIFSMFPTVNDDSISELNDFYKRGDIGQNYRDYYDEFLLHLLPTELGDSIESLIENYPAIQPKSNTMRMSVEIKERESDKFVVTDLDPNANMLSDAVTGGDTHQSNINYEPNVNYFYLNMAVDFPDILALENINNPDIEASVNNLRLYPGIHSTFDYDWTFNGPSLLNYPFSSAFWLKGYAFFNVPFSGYYTFGRRSSGGVKLTLEDVNGQSLSLLESSGWALNVDSQYQMEDGSTQCSDEILYGYKSYTQEKWFIWGMGREVTANERFYDMEVFPYQFYNFEGHACSNDYKTVWGEEQYLEAGKTYLLNLSAWVGWTATDLILQVKGPDSNEMGLPLSWLTLPDLSFDTKTAWHKPLAITESMNITQTKKQEMAVSNYVWGLGTVMGLTQWEEGESSIVVDFYLDDGVSWQETGSVRLNTDIDIDTVSIVNSAYGELWGVLLTDSEGEARLLTIESPLSANPEIKEISLDENIIYSGHITLSDAAERMALGTNTGIIIYDNKNTQGWLSSSQLSVDVVNKAGKDALFFLPYHPDMLYVVQADGVIQKYLYDKTEKTWSKAGFNVQGTQLAMSFDTGEALAIINAKGVEIYSIDFDGNETYQSSIYPVQGFDENASKVAIVADKLVLRLVDSIHVYTAIKDWQNINPDWRPVEGMSLIEEDNLELWLRHSGSSGALNLGFLNQSETNTSFFNVYKIFADEISNYNEVMYTVTINNNSGTDIYSNQVIIKTDEKKDILMKRYDTLVLNSGFHTADYSDGVQIEYGVNSFHTNIYQDTQISIENASGSINDMYIYCPNPEDINIDTLNYKVSGDEKYSQDFEIRAIVSFAERDNLDKDNRSQVSNFYFTETKSVTQLKEMSTGKGISLAEGDNVSLVKIFQSSLMVHWSTTGYMNPEEPEPEVYSIDTPYCSLQGFAYMESGKVIMIDYELDYPNVYMRTPVKFDPNEVKSSWEKVSELSFNHYLYKCDNCAISLVNLNEEESYFTYPVFYSLDVSKSTVDGAMIYAFTDAQIDTFISADYLSFILHDFQYSSFGTSYSGTNIQLMEGLTVELTKVVSNLSNSVTSRPEMLVDLVEYDHDSNTLHIILKAVSGEGIIDWTFVKKDIPFGDSDGDGIIDFDDNCMFISNPEQLNNFGTSLGDACEDTDGDGILDADELNVYGTAATNSDTDGDGLSDSEEIFTYYTDAFNPDSDGDNIPDGDEVHSTHTDPLVPDLCHGQKPTILGGAGNDTLTGTSGVDVIMGFAGNDTIYGKGGADIICGGEGNDYIEGGDGSDYIEGGSGDDTIKGNDGGDEIHGGEGADDISGGNGEDLIYGDAGNDTLDGGDNNDEIHGGDGNDTIKGGSSGDYLYGDAGDDTIKGQSGGDHIYGGEGTDSCDGGDGSDHKYECE